MRALFVAFATIAIAAAPAAAQSNGAANEAPAKAKTVKKVVCQKVEAERTTGSRLGSTTKVCKTVEVPVEETDKATTGGSGKPHAH